MEIKKIAVIGAGAIGSFYGAKLQKAGYDVEFYTRSGAGILNRKKMIIKSPWGNFSFKARAFSEVDKMHKADLVLVTVKVLSDIDYKKLLKPVVNSGTIIMTIQNGINNDEKLKKIFKNNTIIGGLAFTCINRIAPNRIIHQDYGVIKVGVMDKVDSVAASEVVKIFNLSGVECVLSGSLRLLRWKKLLWNVPFNCLSVLSGGWTTDKLIDSSYTLHLANDLMLEVKAIAKAEGCNIKNNEIKEMIENTRKMKPYKTSMLIDYENGKEMEVEAILGEPLRQAKKLKVDTKKMETIYDLLSFYNEV